MLKPKHLSDEQSRSWRPMIGMTHSNQRGRLDSSGHRTLSYVSFLGCIFFNYLKIKFFFIFRHYVPRNQGQYNSVPPVQGIVIYLSVFLEN